MSGDSNNGDSNDPTKKRTSITDDDHAPPRNPNFLKRQLERARFERALEIVESLVTKHAFLNTAELGRLNNILLGESDDPWREGSAECMLPSGRHLSLQILADPVKKAREILDHGSAKAAAGDVAGAATDVYTQFVLTHCFKDANRRVGVLAAAYLLQRHGKKVSAIGLLELGLGDLRLEGQRDAVRTMLESVIRVAGS